MKDLRKTLYLSVGLGMKMLVGLLSVKLCAQYLGPELFGLTGQIGSLVVVVSLLGGAGVNIGLAKIYADPKFQVEDRHEWVKSATWLITVVGIFLITCFVIAKEVIYEDIFSDYDQGYLLIFFLILSVFPIGISAISQGKINGSHRDDIFAASMIIGSFLGLSGLWLLTKTFGSIGALSGLIWLVVAQSFSMIIFEGKIDKLKPSLIGGRRVLLPKIKYLFGYSALSIAAGSIIPIAYIFLRLIVQENYGDEQLGLWQATLRISEAYIQLPLLFLSAVIFPRFASSSNKSLDGKLVIKSYFFVIVVFFVISLLVYFSRFAWINLIFTSEFMQMHQLVKWQIFGDFLRVVSYVGTTILAARGAVRLCIVGEIFQGLFMLLMGLILTPLFPVFGIFYAIIIVYLVYNFLVMFFLIKN